MNENYPRHVAIIMDGNGRWAKTRGQPRLKGHEAGAQAVRRTLQAAKKFGVKWLSLYAFSVENWSRPEAEIKGLMRLLVYFMRHHKKDLLENKTRLRVMGRREDLPAEVQKLLRDVEEETAAFAGPQLILCLSYGGRTEIAAAARRIAEDVAAGNLNPAEVTEQTVAERLYLPDVPDPDLIIRTSGERRLSNFLLWECAYSEFLSLPVLWPDFDETHFQSALEDFSQRHRRYGGVVDKTGAADAASIPPSSRT